MSARALVVKSCGMYTAVEVAEGGRVRGTHDYSFDNLVEKYPRDFKGVKIGLVV